MSYAYEGPNADRIEIPNTPADSTLIAPMTPWPLGFDPADTSPEAFVRFREQARLLLHNQRLDLLAARAEISSLRNQVKKRNAEEA